MILGIQPDPSNLEIGDKLLVSDIATVPRIHIKSDFQRISKANLEGNQLLCIRYKRDNIKWKLLKIAKFLKIIESLKF